MLQVWDNYGESIDRYTVRIDDDVYGMSYNPLSPQGFNQYAGSMRNMDESQFGDEVKYWTALPVDVCEAILNRMRMYQEEH